MAHTPGHFAPTYRDFLRDFPWAILWGVLPTRDAGGPQICLEECQRENVTFARPFFRFSRPVFMCERKTVGIARARE